MNIKEKLLLTIDSKEGLCSVGDCYKEIYAKNYCSKHYANNRKHGSPIAPTRGNKLDFKVTERGCFECTSHKPGNHGYPIIPRGGKSKNMHRWIYKEFFGEIPKGMVVRHTCDNRLCINPEHLVMGTHAQNVQDAVGRGRVPKGEGHHKAITTEREVIEIKKMLETGDIKGRDIAKIFGIHERVVSSIKKGTTWSHVKTSKERRERNG